MSTVVTLDEFFAGWDESRQLFDALLAEMAACAPAEMAVTKSQVAFRRRKAFAWAWIPEKHLLRKAAPLVLSLAFDQRDPSPRWKQVVEPAKGRFMHHLELRDSTDLDSEVQAWLRRAWELAG
jgi:hypothetical protein